MPSTTAPRRTHDFARATDRALVAGIADGDADAFEELYRRHSDRALQLARKLCASRELAEDVAQETFISLWRSAHRYRPALGSVGVWLSSILRNRAIDAWRRAAVRPVETPVIEDGPGQLRTAIGSDTPAPERAVVLSLIAELPAPQKEAVFLAYFGGMTHDEIAIWSQAPLGTVKGRIRMGLQKLREGLDDPSAPRDPATLRDPATPREPVTRRDPSTLREPASQRGVGAPVAELHAARRRRATLAPRRRTSTPAA